MMEKRFLHHHHHHRHHEPNIGVLNLTMGPPHTSILVAINKVQHPRHGLRPKMRHDMLATHTLATYTRCIHSLHCHAAKSALMDPPPPMTPPPLTMMSTKEEQEDPTLPPQTLIWMKIPYMVFPAYSTHPCPPLPPPSCFLTPHHCHHH